MDKIQIKIRVLEIVEIKQAKSEINLCESKKHKITKVDLNQYTRHNAIIADTWWMIKMSN